jgi:hypothetical protein
VECGFFKTFANNCSLIRPGELVSLTSPLTERGEDARLGQNATSTEVASRSNRKNFGLVSGGVSSKDRSYDWRSAYLSGVGPFLDSLVLSRRERKLPLGPQDRGISSCAKCDVVAAIALARWCPRSSCSHLERGGTPQLVCVRFRKRVRVRSLPRQKELREKTRRPDIRGLHADRLWS